MGAFLYFLIPLALFATLAILGAGIYSLAKGGSFARENGNKLMRLRVAAQAIAIALMAVFLAVAGFGPGS
ncbi:MAG: twin transmembrane helix small protein [Parvularculaceae bacterium]